MARTNREHSRQGFVLIITLAILSVLALLGVTFLTLQSVDRDISRTYLDTTRASSMAESGIHDAIATLKALASLPDGYFPQQTGNTLWTYKDTMSVAVEDSAKPSFAYENDANPGNADATPKVIRINGKNVGFSNAVTSGDYGEYGNQYTLKIIDTSSQIYVNDLKNAQLKRVLNNLGSELAAGNDLGDRLINARPAQGYRSKYELVSVLGKTTFDKVKDFITVHAWVDDKVVNPVPLSAEEEASYPVQYSRPVAVAHSHNENESLAERQKHIFRLGHGVNVNGQVNTRPLRFSTGAALQDRLVYGLDELNPQWIETTLRAPVNINTASRPVLISLLKGLSGFTISGTSGTSGTRMLATSGTENVPAFDATGGMQLTFNYDTGNVNGHAGQLGSLTLVSLTDAEAAAIADAIITNRAVLPGTGTKPWQGAFKTWDQFHQFCDGLVANAVISGSTLELSEAKADMIKANFNPNAHLNEMNPDAPLAMRIDKTDLVAMSTEFCFLPTGYFEIESLGRILKPIGTKSVLTASDNIEVSSKKVYSVVHLYDLVRQTSQADFVNGSTLTASTAGSYVTSNGRGLQIGPSPEEGQEPLETTYDGYLTLSSIGGTPGEAVMAPGEARANPVCSPHTGTELLHSHFQHDLRLNYHLGAAGDAKLRMPLSRKYDVDNATDGGGSKQTSEEAQYLLSGGHPVVASSTYSTYAATRAVDTNTVSGWISNGVSPQWLYVDLGSVVPIGQVRVWAGRGAPTEYTNYNIDVSNDAVSWATIASATNDGLKYTVTNVSASCRYVRVYATYQSFTNWIMLYEFQVYGPQVLTVTQSGSDANGQSNPGMNGFYYNYATATASLSEAMHAPYSEYDFFDPAVPAAKKLHEFRMARGFSGSTASGYYYAPSNQRVDGAYSERHSALTYDSMALNLGPFPYYGTVSYWVKPSFHPETATQPRTLFSLARMHDINPSLLNPTPFSQYFLPSYQAAYDQVPYYTATAPYEAMNFATRSFGFMFDVHYANGYGLSQYDELAGGAISRSLNKRSTVAEDGIVMRDLTKVTQERSANALKANRWVHVVLTWDARGGAGPSKENAWEVYVNGSASGTTKILDPSTYFTQSQIAAADTTDKNIYNISAAMANSPRATSSYLMYCGGGSYSYTPPPPPPPPITITINDDPASISLTEVLNGSTWSSSRTVNGQLLSAPGFYGGFSSVVTTRNVSYAMTDTPRGIWAAGGWNPSDPAFFTGERYEVPIRIGEPSLPMRTTGGAVSYYKRNFPADSTVDEFYMYSDKTNGVNAALAQWQLGRYYKESDARYTSSGINTATVASASLPAASSIEPPSPIGATGLASTAKSHILGISWTAYNTTLYDYKVNLLRDAVLQFAVSPDAGTTWVGQGGNKSNQPSGVAGFTNAGWSPVAGAEMPGNTLKYSFRMGGGCDLNTILLESPVLDDVTLYVEQNGPLFVEYLVL